MFEFFQLHYPTFNICKGKYSRYFLLAILLFSRPSLAVDLQFVTEHYPPYQISDNAGKVSGFSVELIAQALQTTNISYRVSVYPWYRAYNMAVEGKNTCIFLIFRSPDREDNFQWVTTVYSTRDDLIGLADAEFKSIDSLQQAKQHRVAVIKNDRTHSLLLNLGFTEGDNLFLVDDTFSLLRLLRKKEVDFIVSGTGRINYISEQHELSKVKYKSYFKVDSKPIELYLACSKNTEASIVLTLLQSINRIKQSKDYQKMVIKWLG